MKRRTEWKYLFLIIVVFVAACIETDIYLPAFPDMMKWFSVSEGQIQGLLTWNFVGICLSGPFYGPISDSYGRKKPIMVALGLFLAGSVVTLFAQTFDQMLMGRILQGIGSGGCFTLGTAIIFDAFQKERAIAALNKLSTAIPLIMAAAPLIGGYLNYNFGFRSNFFAIAIFVLISFVVCHFMFEETLPAEKRVALNRAKIVKNFKTALLCLPFWQITLVTSVLFGGYIAFLSNSSILFVVEFGMSKSLFPLIQAVVLGGWVAGSLTINRCIKKWGIPNIKQIGIALCVIGGIFLTVVTMFAPSNPYLLTAGMIFYAVGANWIIGLYFPEGMELLPEIRGVTASLLTSARLLIAACILRLSEYLYNGTIYPLTGVILATIVILLPLLWFYEKHKTKSSDTIPDLGINH